VSNPYAVLEDSAEEPEVIVNIRPSVLAQVLQPT
jgi:hypothetical protein